MSFNATLNLAYQLKTPVTEENLSLVLVRDMVAPWHSKLMDWMRSQSQNPTSNSTMPEAEEKGEETLVISSQQSMLDDDNEEDDLTMGCPKKPSKPRVIEIPDSDGDVVVVYHLSKEEEDKEAVEELLYRENEAFHILSQEKLESDAEDTRDKVLKEYSVFKESNQQQLLWAINEIFIVLGLTSTDIIEQLHGREYDGLLSSPNPIDLLIMWPNHAKEILDYIKKKQAMLMFSELKEIERQ